MCVLYVESALNRLLKRNSVILPLTQETKMVIMSDLHRGVADWADDLMHNSQIYLFALNCYLKDQFTLVELGDGDELYENRKFGRIVDAHGKIFSLLNDFYKAGKYFYIAGNHNSQMANKKWLRLALRHARRHIHGLFPGLEDVGVQESLKLGDRIFMFHGHHGDPINDKFAWFGRFLVRNVWRTLQNSVGIKDPTSPAKNSRKRDRIEDRIYGWASRKGLVAIAGHTHRPMFCSLSKQQRLARQKAKPYYFNCGSGVHPTCITCLEIENMEISLVKWEIDSDRESGQLRVLREVLEGCTESLSTVFQALESDFGSPGNSSDKNE
jgi:UDP-2,3-diacylglucosamine pyrophosphatase LpxH